MWNHAKKSMKQLKRPTNQPTNQKNATQGQLRMIWRWIYRFHQTKTIANIVWMSNNHSGDSRFCSYWRHHNWQPGSLLAHGVFLFSISWFLLCYTCYVSLVLVFCISYLLHFTAEFPHMRVDVPAKPLFIHFLRGICKSEAFLSIFIRIWLHYCHRPVPLIPGLEYLCHVRSLPFYIFHTNCQRSI